MSEFSTEHYIKIWNDKSGSYVSVGPDSDGLDLVEIQSVSRDGKIESSLILSSEEACLVAKAILELYSKE